MDNLGLHLQADRQGMAQQDKQVGTCTAYGRLHGFITKESLHLS